MNQKRSGAPLSAALLGLGLLAMTAVGGCGASQDGSVAVPSASGSRGVTQGGAQDIGQFRAIVQSGQVPAPSTFEPVGFFAEHAIDLPAADCGQPVCAHPMLAVAPRFDGSNWTMAFVGLNSAVDPASLPRRPLDLALVIEVSADVQPLAAAIVSGLRQLASQLREGDRVQLVVYGSTAVARADLPPDGDQLVEALGQLGAQVLPYGAALYDGLAAGLGALEAAGARASIGDGPARAQRLVLVGTGIASAGITDPGRILALASAAARRGIGLSVVGIGEATGPTLLGELGDLGAGNAYRATSPGDLEDILGVEAATTLVPLATDFELRLTPAAGYRVGAVYGARSVQIIEDPAAPGGTAVVLRSPALFLGHRQGSRDGAQGRRGGGGGLFVQLVATGSPSERVAAGIGPGAPALQLSARYRDPAPGGTPVVQELALENPLAPGENPPDPMWPYFSDAARAKVFMMLNLALVLRNAVEFYAAGDCARSQGVVDMVVPTVYRFQTVYNDADLWADLDLISALRGNLNRLCTQIAPIEPRDVFYGSCMFL